MLHPMTNYAPALDAGAANTIEASVGNTPLVRLRSLTRHLPDTVSVYAKLEGFNPGGSVKDRPALNIIRTAEAQGLLDGKTLLDATSGNMGIAYATFAAARGHQVTLCLPENVSPERIKILRALGAELVLTDPMEGSDGAIEAAQELAAAHPDRYYYANQYDNPANWQAHYNGTALEILSQTGGRVTHFVAGLGTSGTLTGTGRRLKAEKPDVRLIAVQPDGPFHGLEGLKHMPSARRPGIYDPTFPDDFMAVDTESAQSMTRCLARQEGIFAGISSGAAADAAIRFAERLDEGVVVTVFPDGGYKYLSDRFWQEQRGICG